MMAKRVIYHPVHDKAVGEIEELTVEQIPLVTENARHAFLQWKQTTLQERLQWIKKVRLYIIEHVDEIVEIIHNSTGKVPFEALTADIFTIVDMIQHMERHAQKALNPQKQPTPLLFFGKKSYIEYKPRGTVLVISPWNFPFQLSLAPVLSALVAGNSVILKPSEVTPLVGQIIEKIFQDINFPKHVLQVAHGGKEVGAALVDEKPDYIFFTGSVATGKRIQVEAAKNLIPTTLELGGKDPMIILEDANLERAVQAALWGGLTNSGQVCMSVERMYVHERIADAFSARLVEEAKKIKRGLSHEDDFGSMTFAGQVDIVRDHLNDALEKGANVLLGPKQIDDGMHLQPIILNEVNHEMKVMHEETFGPVLPIYPFKTVEEAIELANDSPYGLNASVFSADINKAKQIASQLISGNVVINDVIVTVGNHYLPFGGEKHSGIGRYHGDIGLQTFCRQTSVMIDKGKKHNEIPWYPYEGKYNVFKSLLKDLYGPRRHWPNVLKKFLRLQKK